MGTFSEWLIMSKHTSMQPCYEPYSLSFFLHCLYRIYNKKNLIDTLILDIAPMELNSFL